MSEVPAPLGAPHALPVQPDCAQCLHVHRITHRVAGEVFVIDAQCWTCGCRARGGDYDDRSRAAHPAGRDHDGANPNRDDKLAAARRALLDGYYSSLGPPPVTSPTSSTGTASDGPSGPWERVARCEEGGRNDPEFGYLGIYPSSWLAYGGGEFSPTAGGATWDEQVEVAERINGSYVPDADGCSSW